MDSPSHLDLTYPTPSEVVQLYDRLAPDATRFVRPLPSYADLATQWGVSILAFLGRVDRQPAALFLLCNATPVSGVLTMGVAPQYRGKMSVALCTRLIAQASLWGIRTIWTWCRADNTPARRLATYCGFRECGILPGYADPETLTMDAIAYVWRREDAVWPKTS